MHLLVTQPYVPAYRVPLFDRIAEILAETGDTLSVAAGAPSGAQGLRGDDRSAEWRVKYTARAARIGHHTLQWRTMPNQVRSADAVVSELEALNLHGWRSAFRRTPLILWGHGMSYVNDSSALGDRIEWALAKRATHVMTYAPSGRDFLVHEGGLNPDRVTAIGNSTDTSVLRAATVRLRAESSVRCPAANHALYVGGLDAAKRIDFLLDAALAAFQSDPSFRLTIVGRGILEDQVRDLAGSQAYLTYIEESRGADLARLAHTARAIWMPGRVGLVAVDALAMGIPVHTTDHPHHAPEIEFLHDRELATLPNSPALFASASLEAMKGESLPLRPDIPTIDSVAQAFVRVVRSAWTP